MVSIDISNLKYFKVNCPMSRLKSLTNNSNEELSTEILKMVNEEKPQSVAQLTESLQKNTSYSENEILKTILKLQAQGKIHLRDQSQSPHSLASLLAPDNLWYLLTIAIEAITVSLVLTVGDNYPWIYLRNFLGIIFVLFLPGYAFTKALFPKKILDSPQLDKIVRIVLSFGLSLALVAIIGLLLYYSPWGLALTAITLTLFVVTTAAATAAFFKFAPK